ncbi:winged helix-turn-helix domain-containing protein [Enterococcus sp. LJL128]|uniref:winged helix family transcriptional regulator n=1 Tax=Enterococcus sp. LJL51 TaxID=3416656 RepID=UPI003CEC8ADE
MIKTSVNTGIIALSADLAEPYSEELKKNDINVVPLTMENFERYIDQLDAVIIRENPQEDVSYTCQLLVKIRESSDAFVWVFSSSSPNLMKVVYLQLGAVGVISEDCKADELQLIISNSVSKKKRQGSVTRESRTVFKEDKKKVIVELLARNSSVKINGQKEIPLTKLEYKALEFLYKNANTAVTYKEIFESVWKEPFNGKNYRVANLIFHLREKIENETGKIKLIQTVRSKGYMLLN